MEDVLMTDQKFWETGNNIRNMILQEEENRGCPLRRNEEQHERDGFFEKTSYEETKRIVEEYQTIMSLPYSYNQGEQHPDDPILEWSNRITKGTNLYWTGCLIWDCYRRFPELNPSPSPKKTDLKTTYGEKK